MLFTSAEFPLFFLIFFAIWSLLRGRLRSLWLLAASYFFYGYFSPEFLGLLILSTVVDFAIGRKLGVVQAERTRRILVLASIAVNLGILATFKYFNFFASSVGAALVAAGFSVEVTTLEVVLPVGISFYTFQTLSYSIDVYRRQLEPTESLLDFSLYVAFFPQLVAGPIERASRLIPQLSQQAISKLRMDSSGVLLIAMGAFKKVVLADNFAALVEPAYSVPSDAYGPALWIATYAFAIQIYCDFSGYSDIAIGLGRLMGVELMENFRAPYGALNPSEFWRRWHISLSTWLRDYLYVPLGGNRGTGAVTLRNLALTMLLGGLWHGAAWNFVLWGAYHGLLLILYRVLERYFAASWATGTARVLGWLLFFHLTCLGWALFRCTSLAECIEVWSRLLAPWSWDWAVFAAAVEQAGQGVYLTAMMLVALALVIGQFVFPIGAKDWVTRFMRLPFAVRLVAISLAFFVTLVMTKSRPPPFIYFQF